MGNILKPASVRYIGFIAIVRLACVCFATHVSESETRIVLRTKHCTRQNDSLFRCINSPATYLFFLRFAFLPNWFPLFLYEIMFAR